MDKQTMLANQSSVEETVTSEGDPIVERLTKREYFAGLVLQSLLKNSTWIEFAQNSQERGIITKNTLKVADENSKIIANICVKYADALLAQLEAN
jgi:hypothetical protein